MDGKVAALAVGIAVSMVVVVSCAPTPEPHATVVNETVTVEQEVEVTGAPAETSTGGDMVVAHPGDDEPALLDIQVGAYVSAELIDSFLTDSLICRDPDTMGFKSWLAESWEVSEDDRTYTFYLRDDVKFHDGTRFNAEAVKYNIDRILAPETKSVVAAAGLEPVESVEVIDEYVVAFHLARPYAPLLNQLSGLATPMWSPTALERYGLEEFDEHLVGTGPFMFEERVPKDRVTVVRNPHYNSPPACMDHTGPAYLDSFTFKWIGEEAVLGGIVETDEADVARLPVQYVSDYEADPDYQVTWGYNPGTGLGWVMNTKKAPLDDIRVRKALLHAVDREAMNEMLYEGRYLVSEAPWNPVSMCYWEGAEGMYPYDIEKTNALLDEAEWEMNERTGIREKDGEPLEILWTTLHHEEIGEALQAQLRAVGIDLKVEKVAGTVQQDRVSAGEFDLMYERLQEADPQMLYLMYHSEQTGEGGWNWCGYEDERMDELLDLANGEPDTVKRCEYYEEVQKIVMEEALRLNMLSEPRFWVADSKVEGFRLGVTSWQYYPYMLRFKE